MSFNGIINHCITALIAFLFSTYNILLCNAFNKQSKMFDVKNEFFVIIAKLLILWDLFPHDKQLHYFMSTTLVTFLTAG